MSPQKQSLHQNPSQALNSSFDIINDQILRHQNSIDQLA